MEFKNTTLVKSAALFAATTTVLTLAHTATRPVINKASLTKLRAEIVIDASPAEVWKVVGAGFDKIMHYSNSVEKSYYFNRKEGMVGSQRRSEMGGGCTLDVEITAWEDGKRIEWEIIKAHIPIIKAGVSSYTLIPVGAKTRLKLEGGFKTVFFLLNPIAKSKFKDAVAADLTGIKHLVETGKKVNDKTAVSILARYKDQIVFA